MFYGHSPCAGASRAGSYNRHVTLCGPEGRTAEHQNTALFCKVHHDFIKLKYNIKSMQMSVINFQTCVTLNVSFINLPLWMLPLTMS